MVGAAEGHVGGAGYRAAGAFLADGGVAGRAVGCMGRAGGHDREQREERRGSHVGSPENFWCDKGDAGERPGGVRIRGWMANGKVIFMSVRQGRMSGELL